MTHEHRRMTRARLQDLAREYACELDPYGEPLNLTDSECEILASEFEKSGQSDFQEFVITYIAENVPFGQG